MARYNEPDAPINDSRRGDRHENYVLSENLVADDRESIWTIPARLKRWYFALFSIQVVIATVVLVRAALAGENTRGVEAVLIYLWQYMAPAAVASAAFTLVIVDGINGLMVLSTWLEETLEKRRRRQIRAAVESERQRWLDWNRRREAAADAGEEFTEPPPGTTQPESKSGSAE